MKQCGVCATSLEASATPGGVFPPRAAQRTAARRAELVWESTALARPVRLIAARLTAAWQARPSRPWWANWRNTGTLALAAVPGWGLFLLRRQYGRWALSVACFALVGLFGIAFYQTYLLDWAALILVLASCTSLILTAETLAPVEEDIHRRWPRLSTVAAAVGLYAAIGTIALSSLNILGVRASIPGTWITSGDDIFFSEPDQVSRGDVVSFVSNAPGYGVGPTSVGVVVGLPGETVYVSDRLYVDSRKTRIRLRVPLELPDGRAATSTVRVKRGELWVQPVYYGYAIPEMLVEAGLIKSTQINGKAAAIVGPPARRGRVSRMTDKQLFTQTRKPM